MSTHTEEFQTQIIKKTGKNYLWKMVMVGGTFKGLYHQMKSVDVKRINKNRRKRALKHFKRILNRYFVKGCCKCGNTDVRVLEFDHIKGKKAKTRRTEGVMKLVRDGYAWKKIQKEINKCEVLCRNCHKIRTYKQFNYWKDLKFECRE